MSASIDRPRFDPGSHGSDCERLNGRRNRRNVGVIELLAYTVSSEWLHRRLVSTAKRQMYSVMPQVISVWCREFGHNVTYATYYGQADPISLLPDDLDVVFISASTQASALAYALAKLYRRSGTLTVAGGPHAKCFPEDCSRFFDITVTGCDRDLVGDIVAGRIDAPAIVTADRPLISFPSVAERLPEIETAAFHNGRATKTTVISLFGSVGCPYSCNFCTDWNSSYVSTPAEQLIEDLHFVSRRYPDAMLGFQDPNFGVRFDQTMAALRTVPRHRCNRYLMQCSMSILTETRMQALQDTRCWYVAPGIESWSDYGNKMKMKETTGQDRVTKISGKFARLRHFCSGLQANFIFALDTDFDERPFELTREFIERVPFVWPNLNIVTPYGGTPVYDNLMRERRLLPRMPLALYCSPYLAFVLKHYDPVEFYDHFIGLLDTSTSMKVTATRLLSRDHPVLKLGRLAQTSAVRRDIREMRTIRDEIRRDTRMQAFHTGRSTALPDFYQRHLDQRLGCYASLLSAEDRIPEPASITLPAADASKMTVRDKMPIRVKPSDDLANPDQTQPLLATTARRPVDVRISGFGK